MNNLITVERFKFGKDHTLGRVFLNGKLFCYSVEDEVRKGVKVKGETAIPNGIYPLTTRYSPKFSPKFGHDMIWVKNVPNFEYILIHTGNTDDDTEGCLVIGDRIGVVSGQEGVLNSKPTYKRFYEAVIAKIKQGNQFIEYKSV
jgi:hypothetical protein